MSDILIKNMKMPTWCVNCPMITTDCNSDYLCSVLDEYIPMKWKKIENNFGFYNKETYPKPDWCPLIEVPPHGRLIDADALLESIKEARKKDPEIEDVYIDDYFTVAEWVVSAPTIIEAEDGT